MGVLSFNGNKIITSGNGGAILTNKKKYSDQINHLSKVAKKKHVWNYDYDDVGYNYKLSNINAALGYAQFKKLKKYNFVKRSLYKIYKEYFSQYKFGYIKKEPKFSKSNYWLHTLVLYKGNFKLRNKILTFYTKIELKLGLLGNYSYFEALFKISKDEFILIYSFRKKLLTYQVVQV